MEADQVQDVLARSVERAMSNFIHIPGPNPILAPGCEGSWDEGVIEACDIIKDHDTYYLYYHGTSRDSGYQIGVATAAHPLGPWTKHEGNPVLRVGAEASWDSQHVACAAIIKEGVDRYYMWYSGKSAEEGSRWSIGLATAPDPLGPWEKHVGNPIICDFGYVGSVVRVGGEYYMYTEHPIGSTGPDYGPISLATADAPEGPWRPHGENPVLRQGDWGAWDDGGFSEAKVAFREGIFHVFYGGAKLHPTRILSRESIGYAYSLDGVHFTKHLGNPVAPREANPDAAAFAEVHSYFEPPFVYLYHTLRYNSRDGDEDLGVQILATSRPFSISMPVLAVDSLQAGESTSLEACHPIALGPVAALSVTVEGAYDGQAQAGIRARVRSSCDGLRYDTEDLHAFDLPCKPGQVARRTVALPADVAFAKVLVENLDEAHKVRDIRVTATLAETA